MFTLRPGGVSVLDEPFGPAYLCQKLNILMILNVCFLTTSFPLGAKHLHTVGLHDCIGKGS